MKRKSFTVFLLFSDLTLTGIMMGLGLVLLAGTVSASYVTTIDEDNRTPFIILWSTTALFLLIVGTQLIATILLLYTIGVAYHKYREVDQDQENSENHECVMARLQQGRRYFQLRNRCNIWLSVAIPHLLFIASQFLWPIPTYQYIYYGVLIGFKLLVIGAVVNLRGWISENSVHNSNPSKRDLRNKCGITILTASNTKGLS